jgi:hypothetical protein
MNDRNEREPLSGRHPAKLITYDIGMASTGREQIGVLFEFTDGPGRGEQITWYGHFTPDAFPITVRALKELGWSGERIDTLRAELKPGTVVQLVLEVETYQGKKRSRVKFINRRGLVRMDQTMTREQRQAFGVEVQQMLDQKIHERKAPGRGDDAASSAPEDDDIPF